ncbi:MAG: hypothetical protein AAFP04_09555 [Myxococcota bacterium]
MLPGALVTLALAVVTALSDSDFENARYRSFEGVDQSVTVSVFEGREGVVLVQIEGVDVGKSPVAAMKTTPKGYQSHEGSAGFELRALRRKTFHGGSLRTAWALAHTGKDIQLVENPSPSSRSTKQAWAAYLDHNGLSQDSRREGQKRYLENCRRAPRPQFDQDTVRYSGATLWALSAICRIDEDYRDAITRRKGIRVESHAGDALHVDDSDARLSIKLPQKLMNPRAFIRESLENEL